MSYSFIYVSAQHAFCLGKELGLARGRKPLTALEVKTLKAPGRHADGRNLYLNITRTGAKSWIFLYARDGKQREMGLGSAATVTLQEARAAAQDAKRPGWRPGSYRLWRGSLALKHIPSSRFVERDSLSVSVDLDRDARNR